MKNYKCNTCGAEIPCDALWKQNIVKHFNQEHKELKQGKSHVPFEVIKKNYELLKTKKNQ